MEAWARCSCSNAYGKPYSEEEIYAIQKEGEERYSKNIPPGFKDKDKPQDEFYVYSGVKYPQQYGDLILWKEILRHTETNKIKYLVFITDDSKEDWWWKKSGKTIGPHKQLIEEVYLQTSIENFWMYNTYSFLKKAEKFLKASVKDDAFFDISDVINREVNKSQKLRLQRIELKEYYIPILTALYESDEGALTVRECINRIEPMLIDKFLVDDLKPLSGTGNIRWIANAKFARNDLRRFGYISSESERGIWEITDAGIRYLEENME